MRLDPETGTLDPTFGIGGMVLTPFDGLEDRTYALGATGSDYFDRLNADRLTRYHTKRLTALGYAVTLTKCAA